MSLHVRHTANSSAEWTILLSFLPVLLLMLAGGVLARQAIYHSHQSRTNTHITATLSTTSPPEETLSHVKIELPELPPPPAMFEPESPTYSAHFEFSDEGIELPQEEECITAMLSPAELPPEQSITPRKAPQKQKPSATADYTPPKYASTPQPPYPSVLQRQKLSGSVRVRIRINTQGKPTSVEIINATHPAFAQSARQTVMSQWRFIPAREGSAPVAAFVTTTIFFKL